ncbi:Pathogeneis-related protein 5 [Fusarium oxysporum f. sp. albedinis]|nr:Pathogeneis-related protein 5 [Fusarium oxysporum f. sp. albedinis]
MQAERDLRRQKVQQEVEIAEDKAFNQELSQINQDITRWEEEISQDKQDIFRQLEKQPLTEEERADIILDHEVGKIEAAY